MDDVVNSMFLEWGTGLPSSSVSFSQDFLMVKCIARTSFQGAAVPWNFANIPLSLQN